MASENIIDFTMINWITVFVMVMLGLIAVAIVIGIYTKFKGGAGA